MQRHLINSTKKPQGTMLGMFFFLILINDAGFETQQKEIGKLMISEVKKRK